MTLLILIFSLSTFSKDIQKPDAALVTFYYFDRPPLYIHHKERPGSPSGLIIDKVRRILNNSKIKYRFELVPPKRQVEVLLNSKNTCGIGWYKNEKREAKYEFTLPIFTDGDLFLMSNKEINNPSLGNLFNSDYKFLVNENFSYGEILDHLIKDAKNVISINNGINNIFQMLQRNRANGTFVSEFEKNYFLEKYPNEIKTTKFYNLKHFSASAMRFLMCSKETPKDVIEKIDTAIANDYLSHNF